MAKKKPVKRKKPTEKKKLGRPVKITERVVNKLEQAFKWDYNVTQACIYAGISRTAYYDQLEKDKDFSDKMQDAQEYATMIAKQQHMRLIALGDPAQVRFHLNARGINKETGEHEYKERRQTEGAIDLTLDLTVLTEREEELAKRFENDTTS